ncbi:MAG: guanylate kinase [Legionella sp.]|nr:MAG: guanylate kinase [Legionella sp.]
MTAENATQAHSIGCLFIVAAPSGGGKTSLVRYLIENMDDVAVSVSHTTRSMRPGEAHGVDYFFIESNVFRDMVENNEFVEHAQVFQSEYGTSFAQITERLQQGIDVILDIDWQGAQQIKQRFPTAVSIFIIPPSLNILHDRLIQRQQDDSDVIAHRMQRAQDEMGHYSEFDYLIVNDDFSTAAAELTTIVLAERLRTARQSIQQRKLLSFLLTSK